MRLKKDLDYHAAPYGYIATIPKGTHAFPADNLPEPNKFWAGYWEGITEKANSWNCNYGFLIDLKDLEE